jgi:hypothetical protein
MSERRSPHDELSHHRDNDDFKESFQASNRFRRVTSIAEGVDG